MSRRFVVPIAQAATSMALTLFVASIVVFGLIHLFPGDPAEVIVSRGDRRPTPEAIEQARERLGLDRPIPEQYARWLGAVLQGDLGTSWTTGQPVTERFSDRLPPTILLGFVTLLLGLAFTMPLGAAAAAAPNGPIDHLSRAIATVGTALPSFVLALITLRVVVGELGIGSVITDGTMQTVLLPALVGAVGLTAYWVRPFRALVADALDSEWAVTGRARGWSTTRLLVRHAVPNAMVAFLPFLGLGLGAIVASSVLIENVFGWPGMGTMVVESIRRRDLPVIQGFALISTAAYVLATQFVDVLARIIDPRRAST